MPDDRDRILLIGTDDPRYLEILKNQAVGRSDLLLPVLLAELIREEGMLELEYLWGDRSGQDTESTSSSVPAPDLNMKSLLRTMEELRQISPPEVPRFDIYTAPPREIRLEPKPPEEHPFFFQPQFIVRNTTLPLCCFPAIADPPQISAEDGMRLVLRWVVNHGLIGRIAHALEEGWL